MKLQLAVESLPKINANTIKELHYLGIRQVKDLLFYFPFRYEDFSNLINIIDIKEHENISIRGRIKSIKAYPGFRRHPSRAEAIISDNTASIKALWFNQSYLAKNFNPGDEIYLSGIARAYKGGQLQLLNPLYERATPYKDETIHTARILPIYRLTSGLPLRTLRQIIFNALEALPEIPESLPQQIIDELELLDIQQTIKNLHFPDTTKILDKAKRRISFEEILETMIAVERHKQNLEEQKAIGIGFNKDLVQTFVSGLPFELTSDQKRASWEILQDLEKNTPMNRLLEGDVGSGKTLVAFIAALEVLSKDLQSAMLCPTEILAEQHFSSARQIFRNYRNIEIMLLTSKTAKINNEKVTKPKILQEISKGGPQFIISTHAALQKNVVFKDLALVIIDEQHRFGVRQRAALKLKSTELHPHLLSMTATPIPRTLKLTIFGDLQISQIAQMPSGRKKIITKLVSGEERQKAYNFVSAEIKKGRQAFVITPLIEESDKLGVKAALTESETLKKVFPAYKIGLLHGKMKSAEKEKVMQEFAGNKIQVLVSTSIIEVGIDVPNASAILIEGAERFGLAQLHQFRGRVGRSEHQSYCMLFSENLNDRALSRLAKFEKTTDGFELAEIDLKTRGFGNIFGEEQSGFYSFRYFSFAENADLAEKAKLWAKKILEQDPELKNLPEISARLKNKIIHLE